MPILKDDTPVEIEFFGNRKTMQMKIRDRVIDHFVTCASEINANIEDARASIKKTLIDTSAIMGPRFCLAVTPSGNQTPNVLGMVLYQPPLTMSHYFTLGGLCVTQENCRRGIGTALMYAALEKITEEAASMGSDEVVVMLQQGQRSTPHFYKKFGFKPVSLHRRWNPFRPSARTTLMSCTFAVPKSP